MGFAVDRTDAGVVVKGVEDFDLDATLECGQSFRWKKNGAGDFTGVAGGRVARVRTMDDKIEFIGISGSAFFDFWKHYFDLETDYAGIREKLAKDDDVMQKALEFAPGIRLLNQPLFETLISFIISANNSIPNIVRIIDALSKMYGENIFLDGKEYYAFPEPESLATGEICDLKLSKAGYRCEYIKKTAAMYLSDPPHVSKLKHMGYENAKATLMEYPGVGAKVADCTLLFSGIYKRAFPVDVWIKRIMEKLYLKKPASNKNISEFAHDKFGGLGGYAQQYLFHYARMNPRLTDEKRDPG